MKAIIIEDEPRTAQELKRMLLAVDSGLEVETILGSVAKAIDWLRQHPMPDIIFSDIDLGDGLSFDIFKTLQIKVPVIFCTAFDEYAIRAFEANSIDYLLKPIDEAKLKRSLDKYLNLKEHLLHGRSASPSPSSSSNLERAIEQMEQAYKQTLLVRFREKIIPIKLDEVAFLYASNGLVYLELGQQKRYTVNFTLEQLETMLDPKTFFRANRKFILNKRFIENIENYANRKLMVTCKIPSPEQIIISRVKANSFLQWMEY